MQRHEPIIQLSDHVKNKLKQHRYQTLQSPFNNSSDEFLEVNSIDEDENQYGTRFSSNYFQKKDFFLFNRK